MRRQSGSAPRFLGPWLLGPRCLGLVFAASLTACAPEESPSSVFSRLEVGDATVVENPSPLWAPGEGWTVAREPRLAVGVFQGDDNYQFSRVVAAAVRSDGGLVVADGRTRTVRSFDADGVFEWTLGGPGDGPGEFAQPTQILVGPADSVFVWDDSAYRLTKFDDVGAFAGAFTFDRAILQQSLQPPFYPGQARMLVTGDLLVRLVAKSASKGAGTKQGPPAGRFREESGVLRVAGDLSAVDRLMLIAGPELVTVDAPWGPFAITPPLARRGHAAVHPNRDVACFGDAGAAEVRCFGEGGASTLMRWEAQSIRVSPDDPDVIAWRERTTEELAQKLSAGDVANLLDRVPLPKQRPPFAQILLDPDGNLWVNRGPVTVAGERALEFLVFDPTGRLLGPVHTPPVEVMAVGTDYVLGVHRDDMDVNYVWVLALTKLPELREGA